MGKYSIVIITINKENLKNCIKKLYEYKIHQLAEIIVVEATNNVEEINSENIKYIQIPLFQKGFSNQRNIGINNSSGAYIIFIDDDVEITENWFKILTDKFEKTKDIYLGAMGAVFPKRENANFISFSIGVLGHPGGGFKLYHNAKRKNIELSQISTCNTIFKKDILLDVGMFDTECNKYGAEDSDLCLRITKKYGKNKLLYIPDALVWHNTHRNLLKMIKWYIRRGISDANLFLSSQVSLNYLLRTSFLTKFIIVAITSLLIFKPLFIIFAILWYLTQLYRHKFMIEYFKFYNFTILYKIFIFYVFPIIKFIADASFDAGRLGEIYFYLTRAKKNKYQDKNSKVI